MSSLTLKWGTVKGWDFKDDEETWLILKKFLQNSPMSAMCDHPDDERKNLLCQVIDKMDGEIYNDWEGGTMTKDEAKKYVLEY